MTVWTVEHAILMDLFHQQREQALARMEGMTRVELLAFEELCEQMSALAEEALHGKR